MNILLSQLGNEFWNHVVWTLVNSLWQAAVIALIAAWMLRSIPARNANFRSVVSTTALGLVVVISIFTFNIVRHVRTEEMAAVRAVDVTTDPSLAASAISSEADEGIPSHDASPGNSISESRVTTGVVFESNAQPVSRFLSLSVWISWTAFFWIVGTSFMLSRTVFRVFRAQSVGPCQALNDPQLAEARELAEQFGLGACPKVLLSANAVTPYVVGAIWPTVIVPFSMMTSLTPTEMRSVLAHEFAHIQRSDYLANLFQLVIESVYFFNPAVWWINSQIRIEREACCDLVAIRAAESNVDYATTLAKWAEQLPSNTSVFPAMAFAERRSGTLLERVRRIVAPDHRPQPGLSIGTFGFVIVASIIATLALDRGARAMTEIAADILTHDQRVATIEEDRQRLKPSLEEIESGEATISGKIVASDELPERGTLMYNHVRPQHSTTGTADCSADSYSMKMQTGRISLMYLSENYAPAIVGPVDANKDEQIKHDIRLVKGKPIEIRVVNAKGDSLVGATVRLAAKFGSGTASIGIGKALTDENGVYSVPHALVGHPHQLRISMDGYDGFEETIIPKSEMIVAKLRLSPTTTGVVVDGKGVGVANVEVRALYRNSGGLMYSRDSPPIATTDADGRFHTNLLSSDSNYSLRFRHSEGNALRTNISPGSKLRVQLAPRCDLELNLKGNLAQLATEKGEYRFQLTQTIKVGARHYTTETIPCATRVVGNSVQVTATDLFEGGFTITSGDFQQSGTASPGKQRLYFEMPEPSETSSSSRPIVLRFSNDGEFVTPKGHIRVSQLGQSDCLVAVEDGEARFSLPLGKASVISDGMVGFSFVDQSIEVKGGSDAQAIELKVQPAGAVSGRLLDAEGNPVVASVECQFVWQNDDSNGSGSLANHFESDVDGNFLLTPIPLDCSIRVFARNRYRVAISDEIKIDGSKPKAQVELTLPKTGIAHVTVLDPEGQPVSNMPLGIRLNHADVKMGWSGGLTTNRDGRCEITALSVGQRFHVTAEPRSSFQFASADVSVGEDATIHLKHGNVVRGMVVDKNGEPVANVSVYAMLPQRDPKARRTWIDADEPTNEKGAFVFTRLPAEPMEISCRKPGVASVTVSPSEMDKPIVIEVDPPK